MRHSDIVILLTLVFSASACEVSQKAGEGFDDATTASTGEAEGGTDQGTMATSGATSSGPEGSTGSEEGGSTGEVSASDGGSTIGEGTTGEAQSESGSSSTGSGDGVVYGASVAPTPDRTMLIYKADFDTGTCTRVRLETPASSMPPLDGVAVPDYYNVSAAEISQEPDNCADPAVPMQAVEPDMGSGQISWDEEGPSVCPLDLEIDVTLDYPAGPAWVPASEVLNASIDIEGCP